MAREFDGDAKKIRSHSIEIVGRSLGLQTRDWTEAERSALGSLSLLLGTIALDDWKAEHKQLAVRLIEAKASGDEALYLKLMQRHLPLRAAVMRLGS
jgi:hypothetical protein